MILADTSVWISHFRSDDETLRTLLQNGQIAIHPYVITDRLWTYDRRLRDIAEALAVSAAIG